MERLVSLRVRGNKSGRSLSRGRLLSDFLFLRAQTGVKGNSPGLLRDCQKVVLNLTKKEQGSSGGTNFNHFQRMPGLRADLDFNLS